MAGGTDLILTSRPLRGACQRFYRGTRSGHYCLGPNCGPTTTDRVLAALAWRHPGGLTPGRSGAIMAFVVVLGFTLGAVYSIMAPYTLLVVARSRSLAQHLPRAVAGDHPLIRWALSTTQALQLDLRPDLVILDLPPSGGARAAARLRRRFEVPLLALAPPNQPQLADVAASLEHPVDAEQLAGLIHQTLLAHAPHLVRLNGMALDTSTRQLQVGSTLHQLRPIGTRILALLMARAGTAIPRDELFRLAWQIEDGDSSRALDVHIAHLRQLIEPDPRHPRFIVTERGVGYRFQPPG